MRKANEVKVLVVDDDPDVTTFLATILEDAGINVDTAHDGASALEQIRRQAPDLISLDLVMPGKSGIRLLHELRKEPAWSRIPVIIVTGHGRDENIKRDLASVLEGSSISGPSVYLDKPVTPAKYLDHVCRILEVQPPTEAAAEDRSGALRQELETLMRGADEQALAAALAALRRSDRTSER